MTLSLFAAKIRLEDVEGLDYPQGDLITEGDEGESVAAAVAEITEEEAGIVEDERASDQLIEDGEQLSDIQQAVEEEAPKTEHAGLTPASARLLKLATRRILGKEFADRKLPRMESFNSRADARSANGFVLEGIGEALKSFWEALKAQFNKIWAKIKSWGIKTFSTARKISERAEQIRNRAESSSATIDKRTFKFGQVGQLAIDGKLKDVGAFTTALDEVAEMVKSSSQVPTDAAIEALSDNLDKLVTRQDGAEIQGIERVVGKDLIKAIRGVREGAALADPKQLSSLGGGNDGDAQVAASNTLPGDKLFVIITAKDGGDIVKKLRMTRMDFINTKNKPKEISADAEAVTLNPSQIAKLCDTVAESAGDIATYEQKWQKTDKAQERVLKAIDELVRNGVNNNKDDENATSDADRQLRTIATAATNFVKRMGATPAKVAGFALPVYAATLNWCEGSMRNYKK